MSKKVIIAGAGLVGSLLSIYLVKRGYNVSIYERRGDMRKETQDGGRSINLALSDRGWLALEKVGLAEEIRKIAIPMHGRYIHTLDGGINFQPYGREGQYINSVSRASLNMKLMDLAEKNGATIHFGHKCTSIDWASQHTCFDTAEGGVVEDSFELLFGADGAFSAARLQHQLHHDRFEYHQYYIDCGYKELTIPPRNGDFALEKNGLHIWPRKNFMLIALPNLDKSFTCTLFYPIEGDESFSTLNNKEKVRNFFATYFADVVELMENYQEQFFKNPVSSLVTIKCFPWIRDGKFALIGDAAHAIVPFFGQGMNCGFEDCRILDELADSSNEDWQQILQKYQQLRKPDGDAIADLAVNNFIEMRDKTADPLFLLQKKIEARLHEKYPDLWIPAYTQVTFSPQIRYSEALKRGQMQEGIMQEIMNEKDIQQKWNDDALHERIVGKVKI